MFRSSNMCAVRRVLGVGNAQRGVSALLSRTVVGASAPQFQTRKQGLFVPFASSNNIIRSFTASSGMESDEQGSIVFNYIRAAAKGNLEVVKKTITDKNVDVNSRDYDNRTAMHLAAAEGHLDVCKYLAENGGDVNAIDRYGCSPLEDAVGSKKLDLIVYLRKHGAVLQKSRENVFIGACCVAAGEGDIEGMERLLAAGADLNQSDYDLRTPLHLAASEGQTAAVEWLIKHGALVNAIDRFGNTPLQDSQRRTGRRFLNSSQVILESGGSEDQGTNIFAHKTKLSASVQNSLPLICERHNFEYGEFWFPSHDELEFIPAQFWGDRSFNEFADGFVNAFPKNSLAFVQGRSSFSKVFTSQNPESAPINEIEFPKRFRLLKKCDIKTNVIVPITYDGQSFGIIRFLARDDTDVSEEALKEITRYANAIVSASVHGAKTVPNFKIPPLPIPEGQPQEVFQLIAAEGVFNPNMAFHEIEHFYNMGFQNYYFQRFDTKTIANHIHSYMAAKRLASTTGNRENLWLHIENNEQLLGPFGPEQALYMISNDPQKIIAAERRIQHRISFVPKNKSYSLEYFVSEESPVPGSKSTKKLAIYCLETHDFVTPTKKITPDEHNIWEISTEVFLRDKSKLVRERYEDIIKETVSRLSPTSRVYETYHDGTIPVMFAFTNPSDTHMLHLTELLAQLNIYATRKFVETFANGVVVVSLYLRANSVTPKSIDELISQFRMLHLVPSTVLTQNFLSGVYSAQEYTYLSASSRFAYYFIQQRSDDFNKLAELMKNDVMNLARLRSLNTKLKREAVSESRIYDTMIRHPDSCSVLTKDFMERITTKGLLPENPAVLKQISSMPHELDRQIFTAMYTFNKSILKTNFNKTQKAALSFRMNCNFISTRDWPARPYGMFMMVGSDFQGFHVRFADVARGGIRMIKSVDRNVYKNNMGTQFAENFGLAHTQNMKNKDIPEFGSKGTVLVSNSPTLQENPFPTFQKYVSSMIDLMLPDKHIVDNYGKEELLFLGPDEGSANFMEWAANYAGKKGYKFWRSFTTGKPSSMGGIPHDRFGMTTRSVHRFVLGCLKKMDLKEEEITKVQTGGPDGDLGSNEILISKDKTICIIDGAGVVFDPNGLDRTELTRLAVERLTIDHFDPKHLAADGFRVLITDKLVVLPNGEEVTNGTEFRNKFHLHPLCTADLFVPCGGRPESINLSNVDKMFNAKGEPKFKIICEGANLFLTQDARLSMEEAGVVLYKDASTNKGGVTCSSKEVLAALALDDATFDEHMAAPDPENPPAFYAAYVEEVQSILESDADLEFECIWAEHEKSGIHRHILTDLVSNKINDLTIAIHNSSLWEDDQLRLNVMANAIPNELVKLVGVDSVIERVPDNYLKAMFSTYLASRYVYKYGISASDFALHEFLADQK